MFESLRLLSESEQHIVITYFIGGALLSLNGYVVYQCKKVALPLRLAVSILMCSVGFAFLSAAGRILEGYDDTLTSITQWGVILSTATGFWVVNEFWQRHKSICKKEQ